MNVRFCHNSPRRYYTFVSYNYTRQYRAIHAQPTTVADDDIFARFDVCNTIASGGYQVRAIANVNIRCDIAICSNRYSRRCTDEAAVSNPSVVADFQLSASYEPGRGADAHVIAHTCTRPAQQPTL